MNNRFDVRPHVVLVVALLCTAMFGVASGDLSGAHPVRAQDGALTCGQTVEAELNDGHWIDVWTFDGLAGQTIDIRMRYVEQVDTNLDTRLYLRTPGGQSIEYSDPGDSRGSRIVVTLPDTVTYTIEATRHDLEEGTSFGRYALSVRCAVPMETALAVGGGQLTCGQTVEAELNDDNWIDVWTFVVVCGLYIVIRMRYVEQVDTNLDTRLYLRTPGGQSIEYSDPGDSRSSRIVVTLPDTATYTIEATRHDLAAGTSFGRYALSVRCAVPLEEAVAVGGGQIQCGQTVEADLNDDNWSDYWTFDGVAGQTIDIQMRYVEQVDTNLDTRLYLRTPGGQSIEYSDPGDSRGSGFSYTLIDTATYKIEATRHDLAAGTSFGRYSLSVRCVVPREMAESLSGGELNCNETAAGLLMDDNWVDLWTVTLGAGEEITVQMTSVPHLEMNLDARLYLLSPGGQSLVYADPGDSRSASFSFTVPDTATYTIEATRHDQAHGRSLGRYDLSLECAGTGEAIPDLAGGELPDGTAASEEVMLETLVAIVGGSDGLPPQFVGSFAMGSFVGGADYLIGVWESIGGMPGCLSPAPRSVAEAEQCVAQWRETSDEMWELSDEAIEHWNHVAVDQGFAHVTVSLFGKATAPHDLFTEVLHAVTGTIHLMEVQAAATDALVAVTNVWISEMGIESAEAQLAALTE